MYIVSISAAKVVVCPEMDGFLTQFFSPGMPSDHSGLIFNEKEAKNSRIFTFCDEEKCKMGIIGPEKCKTCPHPSEKLTYICLKFHPDNCLNFNCFEAIK
jgi:hypothetical protein